MELEVLDGVMEDVTDGVWLFGKDSFEECPLTSSEPMRVVRPRVKKARDRY